MKQQHFIFIAAENDAISCCKAGGMGDVVRDVPEELSRRGHRVSVITPAYERLHKNAKFLVKRFPVHFGNQASEAVLYEVNPKNNHTKVRHFVIRHPEIKAGNLAKIYHHDAEEPFATDANKFALFCRAAAEVLQNEFLGKPDILHLHDWHTSALLLLRAFDTKYNKLREIRMVYSIHNLALQGIRPLKENPSSLESWFPELSYDYETVKDPRYTNCINLMAVGIRLADAVHTVSPTYKKEILMPSEPPVFIGGEGLEKDLQNAENQGRLHGILNGIQYKKHPEKPKRNLLENCLSNLFKRVSDEKNETDKAFLLHTGNKLIRLFDKRPDFIACSVARLTDQKFLLFKNYPEMFLSVLEKLKSINGLYILLGTGDLGYENYFKAVSFQHDNFVFINGQSDTVVESIYREGNLYLMPSLFEPCGISQMLAMQHGQPCLAHATGGLRDTVGHLINGFTFSGSTNFLKAQNLLHALESAIDLYLNQPEEWSEISRNAANARFDWASSVKMYEEKLYHLPIDTQKENIRRSSKTKKEISTKTL